MCFPSATHNRFEHSLGVMYLSNKAFCSLKKTMITQGTNEEVLNSLHLHLLIASLLHDVGHAPFSHLGEQYFQSKEKLRTKLEEVINAKGLDVDRNIFSSGSKHELMSCYVIIKKYFELIGEGFAEKHISLDIELICRCIVGTPYEDYKVPANIIINLLNSATIDTDKLDYLMRDAYMTGMDVPTIDTTRLFRNITINENTNSISFFHRALPVIQNIVEARDSMYLWVYNHHITVYTDFVMEYYLKHLILNFETGNRFLDKLNPAQYFSESAIADKMISDSELWTAMKSHIKNDIPIENLSDYTQRIFPQLHSRQFLTPLWKTIYQFRDFMEKNVEDTLRKTAIEKLGNMNDNKMRVAVVKELIRRCGLNLGEVFLVPRSNKFYSLNPKNVFTVYIDHRDTKIDKLLPQKNYGVMYNEVAFYLFCRKDKKEEVIREFIDIISKPLDFELDNISESPKWIL